MARYPRYALDLASSAWVTPNGAPHRARKPTLVASAVRASTRWGCSAAGPTPMRLIKCEVGVGGSTAAIAGVLMRTRPGRFR
jgi:hypothetical protein